MQCAQQRGQEFLLISIQTTHTHICQSDCLSFSCSGHTLQDSPNCHLYFVPVEYTSTCFSNMALNIDTSWKYMEIPYETQ